MRLVRIALVVALVAMVALTLAVPLFAASHAPMPSPAAQLLDGDPAPTATPTPLYGDMPGSCESGC